MSYLTNRKTRLVFPTGGTRDIAQSGLKARQRFLADKATHSPSNPEYAPPGKYNGWTNYDTWATYLMLSNDQRSYRWLGEWAKNWHKKLKSGRFIPDEAEFAVWKYIVPAARGQGRAREWKAGIAYGQRTDGSLYRYHEDEFVGEPRISRGNVNYGEIVDRILEDHPNPGISDIGSGKSGYTRDDYGDLGVAGQ